jgi:glycosyltransferase involved in cell wall biosynthesis
VAFASQAAAHGIELSVINLKQGSTPEICDAIESAGARLITMPSRSLFNLKRLKWLIRFLREERIDIVQTHLLYANVLGSVAAYFAKVPVICTLHSVYVEKMGRLRLVKRLENFCLRYLATRILAVGEEVAVTHHEHYDDRTVDVIPNGIPASEEITTQTRNHLRREIADDDTRAIIITVGRLERVKGYEDMIQAFKLLRETGLKSILLMVGSGTLHDSIQSQVQALHLEQSVILAGERHDIPRLLASSDIFASSSHREGLPLSVLEAMMAGLPIVATAVGDIPNVVTQETGVVVPPHEPARLAAALEELLRNPVRRREMGKAARFRALKEYSLDVWMERHVELYKDVIRSRQIQTVQ